MVGFTKPFERRSAFHSFIRFVIENIIVEESGNVDLEIRQRQFEDFKNIPEALEDLEPTLLPIEAELRANNIGHDTFVNWLADQGKTFAAATDDDVYEYFQDLRISEEFDTLLERSVDEVFTLMFHDRQCLLIFNEIIARWIGDLEVDDLQGDERARFDQPGVLKRVAVPRWARNAVEHRDRGLCTLCHRDLTGQINIGNTAHLDHIVPLAQGGLNDITNLQLLCDECNLKKRGGEAITSSHYEKWYPPDDD